MMKVITQWSDQNGKIKCNAFKVTLIIIIAPFYGFNNFFCQIYDME